jgi:hypothetical protein
MHHLARHRTTGMTDEKLACMTSQIMGAQNKCTAIMALLNRQNMPNTLINLTKTSKQKLSGAQEA